MSSAGRFALQIDRAMADCDLDPLLADFPDLVEECPWLRMMEENKQAQHSPPVEPPQQVAAS